MIIIRADGNSKIGTGHIMRCLSIAKAMLRMGENVLMVTADHEADSMICEHGIKQAVLESDYADMEEEWEKLSMLLDREQPRCMLIDSYFVTPEYIQKCRTKVRVAYMDDYGTSALPVDIVINYNIFAQKEEYLKLYNVEGEEHTYKPAILPGLRYVPLRDEFCGHEQVMNRQVTDVLLTAGGADPMNIAADIAKEWCRPGMENIRLHIVCGLFNKHLQELKTLVAENDNLVLHVNEKRMSALMKKCQLAISAAGSTIYELCAMGVPTVCFFFVENQRRIAEGFARNTPVYCAGDYSLEPEKVKQEIFGKLDEYMASEKKRTETASQMRRLVDGKGADRIAKELIGGKECQDKR